MDKVHNNKAWFLVLPVLVLVAFSAVIPLMTVVNYSVQDTFGSNVFFWEGLGWFRDVLTSDRVHAALGRQLAFSGIILAIALLAMPESPVYLRTQAALASVRTSGSGAAGRRNAASAASDVSSLLPSVPVGALGLLSTPGAGRAVAFALMLGVTQQGTGVVAVVLFGATLLSSAAEAFDGRLETWMALVVPAANLGGAIAGAALIDIIGRRRAFLAGISIMLAALLVPLLLLLLHHAGTPPPAVSHPGTLHVAPALNAADGQPFLIGTLVSMAVWAVAFELGPGCGYFVVITEVTPPELRPLAVSLGNTCR
jgi:hypothetical protein